MHMVAYGLWFGYCLSCLEVLSDSEIELLSLEHD